MVMELDYNQVLEHVQINNIVLAAAGDGVVGGLDVSERGAGANMSVDVATGSAVVGGTTYTESSVVNLVISAADVAHARKDLVIYDVATTNPLVVTGTPATPPVPPDITAGDILLAIVDVAANETEITNSEVIDCVVEVESSIVPVARGGTGVTSSSSVADVNATMVDGCSAGVVTNTVYKIPSVAMGRLPVFTAVGMSYLTTNGSPGYQLTSNGAGDHPRWAAPYSHPSARQCTTGTWAAASITGILAVANGGTGVSDDSYDADKVDGCDAGTSSGNVFKIPTSGSTGTLYMYGVAGIDGLLPGTLGYQLTSVGPGNALVWAAASDLIFSDTHCPKCGQEFQDGDDLILHVIGHNEVGDLLTLPMHLSCANAPKKIVTVKRRVMEDQYILDEETGELKVQRVQKTVKKTVMRHKLKEGCIIDVGTGKAHRVSENGHRGNAMNKLADAIEEIEEEIEEVVYEDIEYNL